MNLSPQNAQINIYIVSENVIPYVHALYSRPHAFHSHLLAMIRSALISP